MLFIGDCLFKFHKFLFGPAVVLAFAASPCLANSPDESDPYRRALEQFWAGNFQNTKKILASSAIEGDENARHLYIIATEWNKYSKKNQKSIADNNIEIADQSAANWKYEFLDSSNNNISLYAHRKFISISNGWSIPPETVAKLKLMMKSGYIDSFYPYLLSKMDGIIEEKYKEKFSEALKGALAILDMHDFQFWTSFGDVVFINGVIKKEDFFEIFGPSLNAGDGRVHLLACQLSLRRRIDSLLPYDTLRFCIFASTLGYSSGLESLATAPYDILKERNLSASTFFEKFDEFKQESHIYLLRFMGRPTTLPYLAGRWCQDKRLANHNRSDCFINSSQFHQRCLPDILGNIRKNEFITTRAYDLCRSYHFDGTKSDEDN